VVPCAPDGSLNTGILTGALEKKASLVVINHASNVTGTILPVAEAARLAHDAGALLLVDAAQSAGVIPIDIKAMGADLLAFTGHKGLQGPPGTGGLVISTDVDASRIKPLMRGGTGSRSESEHQPEELPDKFEGGTANLPGIAGLGAGIRWLMARGIASVRGQEQEMSRMLRDGLSAIPGIRLYGTQDAERSIAIISFTMTGKKVSEIGLRLDKEFGILIRVGLHCAPAAHRTIGSFPEGTVRLAPGVFTTSEEIYITIGAVEKIARS
jgi:selenocysteine lyase/cysteine desulfurase